MVIFHSYVSLAEGKPSKPKHMARPPRPWRTSTVVWYLPWSLPMVVPFMAFEHGSVGTKSPVVGSWGLLKLYRPIQKTGGHHLKAGLGSSVVSLRFLQQSWVQVSGILGCSQSDQSVCISIRMWRSNSIYIYMYNYLYVYVSIYVSIYVSLYLYVSICIYLSIYLPVCLSVLDKPLSGWTRTYDHQTSVPAAIRWWMWPIPMWPIS